MRFNIIIAFVLLAVTASLQSQEIKILPNSGVRKASLDFSEHLEGPARWQLGAAGTLTLKMDGDSTVFLLNGNQEEFRLNGPEYIKQAVLSGNGNDLMLVAMKSRGYGSDFAALIRVQSVADKLKISRVFESGQKLFDSKRWWISEMGAISDDSSKLLAKFGVGPSKGDTRMIYRWYTVEVNSGRILSEGLTIANSKPPTSK